jgi:hypothetical protein
MTISLDDPYFRLQAARRAHRAAAHKYARTKNTPLNKPNYDVAVDNLERAALAFALCAAEHGARSGVADPAFSALTKGEREAYKAAVNPEPDKDNG